MKLDSYINEISRKPKPIEEPVGPPGEPGVPGPRGPPGGRGTQGNVGPRGRLGRGGYPGEQGKILSDGLLKTVQQNPLSSSVLSTSVKLMSHRPASNSGPNVIIFVGYSDSTLPSLKDGEVCQGRKVMQGPIFRGPQELKGLQVSLSLLHSNALHSTISQ